MKKLVKKTLPIIMSAMVVTSMTAISMTTASATSTYVNEETGVKFESDIVTITGDDVGVYTDGDVEYRFGMYEKKYDIEMSMMQQDYNESQINLYLPCEKENCYVILDGFESERVQLDAEYVDGCYKVRMPNWGTYYICETPLVTGYSKFEQTTLTDETTGVSISGKIESGSGLVAYNVQDMYKVLEENDSYFTESPFALIGEYDGYGVFLSRNMEDAYTQGELTVTLPSPNEGYEVRCINSRVPMSDKDAYEDEILGFELTSTMELSDEELAERYTALMNKVYPPLQAEYVNGSYVVKSNNPGYYFIAPAGSFAITADKIHSIRAEHGVYDNTNNEVVEYEDSTEGMVEFVTAPDELDTATQANTEPTKKPTVAKKVSEANSSKSIIVPVVCAVVAVLLVGTTIVLICKKKSAKK